MPDVSQGLERVCKYILRMRDTEFDWRTERQLRKEGRPEREKSRIEEGETPADKAQPLHH